MTQSFDVPRRFDLVVASYVIGEARSPLERRRLVDSLWRRTGGLLVLVEPGTPVGSANIREARAQVCFLPVQSCVPASQSPMRCTPTHRHRQLVDQLLRTPMARYRGSVSEGASSLS